MMQPNLSSAPEEPVFRASFPEEKPPAEDKEPIAFCLSTSEPESSETMLDPEIEKIINDFRTWLLEAKSTGTVAAGLTFPEEPPPPDLHTLLGQFVALRQEVNLQTRAVRNQQELNAQTLGQLEQALQGLERQQAAAAGQQAKAQEDILRPVLKTLVDLYDSLGLARRELLRIRETVAPLLQTSSDHANLMDQAILPPAGRRFRKRSFWARWFAPWLHEVNDFPAMQRELTNLQALVAEHNQALAAARQELARLQHAGAALGPFLDSVITGYTMSLQRLERALQQHELEAISCVDEPFDPETMEAVAVVVEPGRLETEVIEEVRRGYWWRGRVFRFAQVRVAKPAQADEDNNKSSSYSDFLSMDSI